MPAKRELTLVESLEEHSFGKPCKTNIHIHLKLRPGCIVGRFI